MTKATIITTMNAGLIMSDQQCGFAPLALMRRRTGCRLLLRELGWMVETLHEPAKGFRELGKQLDLGSGPEE